METITVLTMNEAMRKQNQFKGFIFDDPEDCILNHGIYCEGDCPALTHVFWTMLNKMALLITSSIDKNFFSVLKELGYLKNDAIYDFYKVYYDWIGPHESRYQYDICDSVAQSNDKLARILYDNQTCPSIVVCNSLRTIQDLPNHEYFKDGFVKFRKIRNIDDLPTDLDEVMPKDQVTLIHYKIARGLHIRYPQPV